MSNPLGAGASAEGPKARKCEYKRKVNLMQTEFKASRYYNLRIVFACYSDFAQKAFYLKDQYMDHHTTFSLYHFKEHVLVTKDKVCLLCWDSKHNTSILLLSKDFVRFNPVSTPA